MNMNIFLSLIIVASHHFGKV